MTRPPVGSTFVLLSLAWLLDGCGGSPAREAIPAASDGSSPRTPPASISPPRPAPAKLRTPKEARFDELTMSFEEYLKVLETGDFKPSGSSLNLSKDRPSFTTRLEGPAHRYLRERKEARMMWIHVPMTAKILALEGLFARLTRQAEAERQDFAPDRAELEKAREITREEYLRLLRKGSTVLFLLFDRPQSARDDGFFALVVAGGEAESEGRLEWVRGPLSASFPSRAKEYLALREGLDAWRVQTGDWLAPEGEDAVLACLVWLARHQAADGSWSATEHVDRCVEPQHCRGSSGSPEVEIGLTSLGALAFMGAAYSHRSTDRYRGILFANVVWAALRRLMELQDRAGWFGAGPGSNRGVLNHALATSALAEAYALTHDKTFERPALDGVGALRIAQNPNGGWGDAPARSDGFTTGMVLVALRLARAAGIDVDRAVEARGLAYLEGLQDRSTGRVGYVSRGVDGAVLDGVHSEYASHPTLSTFPLIVSDNRDRRQESLQALNDYPEVPEARWHEDARQVDYVFLFLCSWARFRIDGPSGPHWKRWSERLRAVLVDVQVRRSEANVCEDGSWKPVDKWSCVGGRVYTTAINALTLEIYYRYENSLGKR